MSIENNVWYVYLLECLDGSLYTGITNNVEKRLELHKKGVASKYTRAKGFKRLVGSKRCVSRSQALTFEYRVKQLSKVDKVAFFS